MSDTNVIGLNGHVPLRRPADPAVLREAERLLEAVRSGEVVGFHGSTMNWDETSSLWTAGKFNRSAVGTMAVVQAMLVQAMLIEYD